MLLHNAIVYNEYTAVLYLPTIRNPAVASVDIALVI